MEASFQYMIDIGGNKKEGNVLATSTYDAVLFLRSRFPDGRILSLRKEWLKSLKIMLTKSGTMKGADGADLARKYSLFFNAGLDPLDTTRILKKGTRKSGKIARLTTIEKSLEQASPFWRSLQDAGFPKDMIPLIRTGEANASLPQILMSVSGLLEQRSKVMSDIRKNLLSPVFSIVMVMLSLYTLVFWIIPGFSETFQDLPGIHVPHWEQALYGADAWVVKHDFFVFSLFALLVSMGGLLMTIDSVRKTVVRFIRRFFPPLDDLLRLKIGYRFVVGYRINESAGLSPVEAISSMTIGSAGEESVIYRHIERSIRERQTTLSEAIRRSGAFPENLPEWLDPAERNARLGEEMGRIEMVYQEMIREKIEFFKGSIKPVTTILVGGLVLFGFAAMWIPLFGMIENLMTGGVAVQH